MNRYEFLYALREKLFQLPESEIQAHLSYYEEMIDDRMEDGMTEEEAVASLEEVSVIAERILQETPITTLVKTKVKPKKGWTPTAIVLAVIGSPIWLSILIVLAAVVISVVVTLWSVVIAIGTAAVGIIITGLLLIAASPFMLNPGFTSTLLCIAGGLCAVGVAILLFVGTKYLAKGIIWLCKAIFKAVKSLFIRKER